MKKKGEMSGKGEGGERIEEEQREIRIQVTYCEGPEKPKCFWFVLLYF